MFFIIFTEKHLCWSLFYKSAVLEAAAFSNFIKQWLQYSNTPTTIFEIFKNIIFTEHSLVVAASGSVKNF